eukprot:TRINITY_DN73700_c0_g1_i1.p1 TRINITY_DN73700_c0_g1~~TRINITY_DN73700_c0_g1_i1.p1  ORF type:complete len:1021 (+),score=129.48 TRINITY_DN73700_c0_g1_i1:191-3064(+)
MPGLSVADPDGLSQDVLEVTLEVDPSSGGGALELNGTQHLTITKRLPIADMNRELQKLRMVFSDDSWFGVVGVHVSVSDLGQRGWTLREYEDMYHRETKPQVLALRDASVAFSARYQWQFHQLFSGDFTWEVYVKRIRGRNHVISDESHEDIIFQNFPKDSVDPMTEAHCRLTIDQHGRTLVSLRSEVATGLSALVGGYGRVALAFGTWYHLAVVVRRSAPRTPVLRRVSPRPSDATAGEVALFVDGALDTTWTLDSHLVHFGPARQLHISEGQTVEPRPSRNSEVVIAGGSIARDGSTLLLSRLRLWGRPLDAGELGRCNDLAEGIGSAVPVEAGFGRWTTNRTILDASGMKKEVRFDEVPRLTETVLSFVLDGSLAEVHERASVTPTGDWSFSVDTPPRCLSLTESPNDAVLEQCVRYDRSLALEGHFPYVWHSPQALVGGSPDFMSYANSLVEASTGPPGLRASTFVAVYRSFVNEPPRIRILEPQVDFLDVLEDHPSYLSFELSHKAAEHNVPRSIGLTLSVSHGRLRSLTGGATVRLSAESRREIHYRGPIHDLNELLVQIEYVPDPSYSGPDRVDIGVSDVEFTVNATLQIIISELSDPLTLVCPPAIDLVEGLPKQLLGTNISIHDAEQSPGARDVDTLITTELLVGGGRLSFNLPTDLAKGSVSVAANVSRTPRSVPDSIAHKEYEGGASNTSGLRTGGIHAFASLDLTRVANIVDSIFQEHPTGTVAAMRFNSTISELRFILAALHYTPFPELFNGVIHFGLTIAATSTGQEASCDIGLIVHPKNSPPAISVDKLRLSGALDSNALRPHEDVDLSGVIQLSDPDEEDLSDWFSRRTHTSRFTLNASCGSMSFGFINNAVDYVLGVQSGSIAGSDGLTFHEGDGYRDVAIDVTSTIDHLNGQLHRLLYHSQGCRGKTITIFVALDDLGNYGSGGPLAAEVAFAFNVSEA